MVAIVAVGMLVSFVARWDTNGETVQMKHPTMDERIMIMLH